MFLEVGFSRMKNVGTIVPKVLANFSIAALCYWAVGFALAFGGTGWFAGTEGTFLGTTNGDLFPAMAFSSAVGAGQVLLPVRLLRRLARDRVGHHPRADQVRRLPHLRGDLQRADLPDHQPLDLRRRLAAGQLRHAGLRGLDRGAPDGGHRSARCAAAARPAPRQVQPRRRAERHPRAQHAPCGARGARVVVRLVRLQRGIHAGRDRPALRRRCRGHQPGGRGGGDRGDLGELPACEDLRHRHGRKRGDRRARGHHRALGLRRVLGRARSSASWRAGWW